MTFYKQIQESCDRLLQQLADGCSKPNGLSAISCSPYDTAWVTMVVKPGGKESRQRLFPSSFSSLLAGQSPDGGWRGNSDSHVDHILKAMAALLTLIRHRSSLDNRSILPSEEADLGERIARATTFLRETLQVTDLAAADRAGLELLVPVHQRLLQEEGVVLDFPSATYLNLATLAHFSPELLYGRTVTTLMHALEAFVEIIDFDRVRHRLWYRRSLADSRANLNSPKMRTRIGS